MDPMFPVVVRVPWGGWRGHWRHYSVGPNLGWGPVKTWAATVVYRLFGGDVVFRLFS